MKTEQKTTTKQRGEQNTIDALAWISKFGWLRSQEIGQLIWPHTQHNEIYGNRLGRKLSESKLVIGRKLPSNEGVAWVLSEAGARFLNENSDLKFKAVSGKDWGITKIKNIPTKDNQVENKTWTPPSTWKHDLLATGVLIHFFKIGWEIRPEIQLRRENIKWIKKVGDKKIPDGLARISNDKTKDCLWIEVEKSRKTGNKMTTMVNNLIEVFAGNAPELSGMEAKQPCIFYAANSKNNNGHNIDHLYRVVQRIKRDSNIIIKLFSGAIELRGCGVKDISFKESIIVPNKIHAMVAEFDNEVWMQSDNPDYANLYHIKIHNLILQYWKFGEGSFSCRILRESGDREIDTLYQGEGLKNKEECKQYLADAYHKLTGHIARN